MDLSKLRQIFEQFRILIIGRANAGKTTILQRVCKTCENPEIYDSAGKKINAAVLTASTERGLHNIENEMVFRSNPGFVFHDSRGFEAGGQSEFDKVKAFITNRSNNGRLKDRIHVIWYCIPMDEDSRSFTEAEVKFFSQCDTGSIPVIVLFTKFDALYDDEFAELITKGLSRKDARALASQHARESFANGPQVRFLYNSEGNRRPPKCHICLPDMNNDDADCGPLIERTAEILDDDTLKQLFVSTQRTNLEVCIIYAVERTLARCLDFTQIISSCIFEKFEDSRIVDDLGAWFPLTSGFWRWRNDNDRYNFFRHCYRPEDKEMWSTLHSVVPGSSTLEDIVQFGSAAVIILEHAFYLWDQQPYSQQVSVHPVHAALQQYIASPNAAAVRQALSSAVHTYQMRSSRWMGGLINRQQKKAFVKTIIEVILQHRLPRHEV